MSRNITLLAFIIHCCCTSAIAATDTAVIKLTSVSVIPNSVNGFYLLVNFTPDLPKQKVDEEFFHTSEAGKTQFRVTYQGIKSKGSCIITHSAGSSHGFGVIVRGFSENQIRYFLAKDNQIGLECTKDFTICYYSDSINNPAMADLRYGTVKASDVNALIKKQISITDSDRSSYVTAINDFYYFENKIDFGVAPGSNGSETSFDVSANIRNKYGVSGIFSCESDSGNKPRLYWGLDTRLSTNFSDSLNYINFSPVNLSWSSRNFARQLNVKLANESDQSFTNKRAVFDASYRSIFPNLVNLTTPTDDRLRLKPIITIGAKGYYDYSNNITAFTSGQGYGKLYYYIPVYSNYSIIVNATAFYDLSDQRNPTHKVSTNYSVVIASELPSTGFKAIVKFENGQSDISSRTGKTVLLGFLMDFLKDKKTTAK